ncbi:MAG TPA: lysophospholipid acyltransferase family protein [Candidatus Limnocylindrales bacterium]|nr:lysophospholipid acyltransferase family protein [Candidatus Limnocylindrales bacterium]
MTTQEHRLEAPHRRVESRSRILERAAVITYRATAALLSWIPPRLSTFVIARFVQLGYLVMPRKRSYSNANFGHVLGLPPGHPRVRALALRAYASYARYIVELMRLPSRPHEELRSGVEAEGVDDVAEAWRASGGPLIVVAAHVGNNEAVAAGIAERGYPISVVADDTAFPELFELLRRQRESWGVRLIPWRNLRELFSVLRRGEILALLVDWGYRADGIPVRLFDAWTTLPAGPATLAAKSGATIVPVVIRRRPDGRFHLTLDTPISASSTAPAETRRVTQAIAAWLERTVAAAPEQWYSFKPIWPATEAEQASLAARAAELDALTTSGRPGASPGAA